MTSQASSLIVGRLIDEGFNRGYVGVVDEVVAEGYRYSSGDRALVGREALKALIESFREGFPDLRLVILEQIEQEERVCTSVLIKGTHMGSFMGLPGTGRSISVRAVVISRVVDERIVEEWEMVDELSLLRQLGLQDSS